MARSTPKLWSSVSICLRLTDEELAIQAELLDQWLCLARSLPLSITMTFDREGTRELIHDPSFTTLTAVTSVAASLSHQWESLDLFLPSAWAETLEYKMGRVPNLKSLDIKLYDFDCQNTAGSPFLSMFLDAPKLRTVTIACEDIDVGLPYHQLEELTFWGHLNDLPTKTFLRRCTNLEIFRIHDGDSKIANEAITSHMPVHLSKLVSLEIIALKPQQLLGYLQAPSLISITIPLKGPDEIEAFSAFLTRSDVTLKHLSIIDYVPNEEELLWKIFDTLPNLSYLEIDEPFQSDKGSEWRWLPSWRFFNYFSTPNTASGALPLPHLTSVKYRGQLKLHARTTPGGADGGNSVYVDTLEKVFLSRWNTGGASQLQVFSMSIIDSPSSITKMERSLVVKKLRKEGMRLVFESVEPREYKRSEECRADD